MFFVLMEGGFQLNFVIARRARFVAGFSLVTPAKRLGGVVARTA
jgi:hypothetical protein